jgi:hypothetical protein
MRYRHQAEEVSAAREAVRDFDDSLAEHLTF